MNKLVLLLFLLSGLSAYGQAKPNISEIEKNVQDSTSVYYYERLAYRFVSLPSVMDLEEARHLYYGQHKGRKNALEAADSAFQSLIAENKCREAIPAGEQLLRNDPVNMEVLGRLLQCYSTTDRKNPQAPLRMLQFRILAEAVLSSAIGANGHKTYTVMDVVDEYIIAGTQSMDLRQFRRRTQKTPEGMMDNWKRGKKKISFLVIYPEDE